MNVCLQRLFGMASLEKPCAGKFFAISWTHGSFSACDAEKYAFFSSELAARARLFLELANNTPGSQFLFKHLQIRTPIVDEMGEQLREEDFFQASLRTGDEQLSHSLPTKETKAVFLVDRGEGNAALKELCDEMKSFERARAILAATPSVFLVQDASNQTSYLAMSAPKPAAIAKGAVIECVPSNSFSMSASGSKPGLYTKLKSVAF